MTFRIFGLSLIYRRCLEQPLLIISGLIVLCVWALYSVQSFRFDASADTLIARSDPELQYYNKITQTFGDVSFLVLTVTPKDYELFSPRGLELLKSIVDELAAVPDVSNVASLFDAPLLRSPPIPLDDLADGKFRTLASDDIDLNLARQELTSSALFSELLVSADGTSTAVRIDIADSGQALDAAAKDRAAATEAGVIEAVRAIRQHYAGHARLYLGGVPMVRADMVTFVKEDMAAFGGVVLLLLAGALYLFFRRLRWVLIPLATTLVTLLITTGVLATIGQPATTISSSFVALISIITISFTVHLINRYREVYARPEIESQCSIVFETMRSKFMPCLYTALTTMVAFASLLTSDIVPVIDFGWIMCIGITISLLITYSFFASVLVLLPKNESCESIMSTPGLTAWFSAVVTRYPWRVIAATFVLAIVLVPGLASLTLGNRIVEYFRADTEIRQGLDFIDRELGGTIPIDIVLKFDPFQALAPAAEDDPFADDFAAESDAKPDSFPERFWFSPQKIAKIDKLQQYLNGREAVGKSVSLASLERVGRGFNEDQPLSYLQLTAILGAVPESVRAAFIDPYASPSTGEVRISSRLHETGEQYDLDSLIGDIERFAVDTVGFAPDEIRITGVAVLFNGMLTQLLSSQLSTLGFVVLATFIMFALLLRSPYLGIVGVFPNALAAVGILAVMGVLGIPLDMMTITIAAIVIGIGVDDAIHYLHHYEKERQQGLSSRAAVQASHASIGKALYFTSLIVIIGFSVLLLSRFMPTVYFGALAAVAMGLALVANLALLPAILVLTDKRAGGAYALQQTV
jgi:hypothetical protein